MASSIRRVLIANRGEIAVRVIRSCRELGIQTVAIYSEPDRESLHVRLADRAYALGGESSAESYLLIEKVLAAAKATEADAIHPGYGFLSENPEFVRAVEAAGITFIGPRPEAMEQMGEKTRARSVMQAAGVPVVPGSEALASGEEAAAFAEQAGLPVMVKAAAGGGGKGMRRVDQQGAVAKAFEAARSEAKKSFGDDRVYVEKYLLRPRHIEVQVLADSHGNCVHLFERECSIQRRHQKVIEEAPSPFLSSEMRAEMGRVAVQAAKAVDYVGAGTVEFLCDAEHNFYFLEMNTRLQVEHPVTEWITGLDLVALQIAVAEGAALPFGQEELEFKGHAIEARIYAEDPQSGFLPAPGKIEHLHVPAGPYVRDDSGVVFGSEVTALYDPMISKLSVWGQDRAQAIARLDRALAEYRVIGVTTNIAFLRRVLAEQSFGEGDFDTGFIGEVIEGPADPDPNYEAIAMLAAVMDAFERDEAAEAAFKPQSSQVSDGGAWRRFQLLGGR